MGAGREGKTTVSNMRKENNRIMKDVKMIVTDLDGTLLKNDKTISNYSLEVFKKYGENLKIVCATARPFRNVKKYCDLINFDTVICHNGAVIYEKGKIIDKHCINIDSAKEFLLNILSEFPETKIAVEINDILYGNFDTLEVWKNDSCIYTNIIDLPNIDIEKIIIIESDEKKAKQFEKHLPSNTRMQCIEGFMLLITNENGTKYKGIQSICTNINISNVVAFGDDYNDIEMVQKCGIGVCVANGLDAVKQVADYICETNEKDGVAKWIEEHIL